MFINKITLRRVNPHARYIDQDGTQYNKMPADLYEEIADPVRESDETHYVQEIDEYPYIINTPKPPEMLEAARVAKIDAEIRSIEQEAIEQGLIRLLIDDLLMRAREIAASAKPPITEAQLLDPTSEFYSVTFAKVHANEVRRAEKRAGR